MEQISINLLTTGETPVCHVSQYDIGRTIRFNLISDSTGEAYTLDGSETINIRIRKPDGTETTESIASTSGSYIDFATSEETCDQSGENICELRISKAGATLGTKNFRMKVEADAYDGEGVIVESASGAIATFETNIIENLVECKCNIDAIQDLHGYNHPWSGGAGKNKYKTTTTTPYATLKDGIYTLTSLPTSGYSFRMDSITLKAGSYILNGGVNYNYRCFIQLGSEYITTTGNDAPFTLAEDTEITVIGVIMPSAVIGQQLKPMVRLSSISDATYEPYENICPIYGHSEATIIRTGVNLWDEDWELGALQWANGQPTAASDRIRSKNYNPIKAQTQYYMRTDTSITSGVPIVFYYDKDKNLISYSESTIRNTIIETPANTAYFKLCILQTTSYTSGISLNFPASDRDYHPYAGEVVTVQFGQEVFGGILDASSGKLTITDRYINNISNYYRDFFSGTYSTCYRITLPTVSTNIPYSQKHGAISNCKAEESSYWGGNHTAEAGSANDIFAINPLGEILAIYDSDTTLTKSTFETKYSNFEAVYPLATPIIVQLSPTEVETIIGQRNNVSCSTGNISVKYYKKA